MKESPSYSTGNNRAVLVLCDSRQVERYAAVAPAFIAALEHWGMPYFRHDLAQGALSAEMLARCAALLLAQQGLGAALTPDAAHLVAEAVADGLGYVGGDSDIGSLPIALQHALGVSVQDIQPAMGVQTLDVGHFVSAWQMPASRYDFKRPLEMTHVLPAMSRVRVLLESDGHPALWVTQYGRGRMVQWALPPLLWQYEAFGHCEGLDDLLWRGLVWAARKPFAMLAMPPFSTAVVGDAIGSHDFAWIEALCRRGFPPNVGIFPDDVDALSEIRGQSSFFDRAVESMRHYAGSGQAEFSPHAATFNRAYLLYSRASGSEISTAELAQRLAAVDKQFGRYGVPWARTLNPHYGQLGRNALPFLLQRGVQFSLSELLPGESYEGERRLWGGAPFGHPGFTIAPLPQSPDFYVVTSSCAYHGAIVPTGPGAFRLRPGAYMMQNDLMWGRTRWKGHCQIDDWEAMAQAAARQIRLGLNALFFAAPKTNEQCIARVSLDEWSVLWREIERRVAGYERRPMLYSDIAVYARARHRTRLAGALWDGAVLKCELEGSPDVPLLLYVWSDFGDSEHVVYRYEKIEAFTGARSVAFAAR